MRHVIPTAPEAILDMRSDDACCDGSITSSPSAKRVSGCYTTGARPPLVHANPCPVLVQGDRMPVKGASIAEDSARRVVRTNNEESGTMDELMSNSRDQEQSPWQECDTALRDALAAQVPGLNEVLSKPGRNWDKTDFEIVERVWVDVHCYKYLCAFARLILAKRHRSDLAMASNIFAEACVDEWLWRRTEQRGGTTTAFQTSALKWDPASVRNSTGKLCKDFLIWVRGPLTTKSRGGLAGKLDTQLEKSTRAESRYYSEQSSSPQSTHVGHSVAPGRHDNREDFDIQSDRVSPEDSACLKETLQIIVVSTCETLTVCSDRRRLAFLLHHACGTSLRTILRLLDEARETGQSECLELSATKTRKWFDACLAIGPYERLITLEAPFVFTADQIFQVLNGITESILQQECMKATIEIAKRLRSQLPNIDTSVLIDVIKELL